MARRICTAGTRRASAHRKLVHSITVWHEQLESRYLLATITLTDGNLLMLADSATLRMTVDYSSSQKALIADINDVGKTFPLASVSSIQIVGGDNPEYISVSNTISLRTSIHGGAGNDTIYAGGGNDHVWGEDGNDVVSGRDGNDSLYGGNGNDTLDGANGVDTGDAGPGINSFINIENITGGLPVNPPPITAPVPKPTPPPINPTPAPGESGTIELASDVLTILGDANTTKINVGYESSDNKITAQVNSGTVQKFSMSSVDSISVVGGPLGEKISVSAALTMPTLLRGMGGNDTITGGAGNDSITGDDGNDSLTGGAGNDGFMGGAGNDTINGGVGNDLADGGAGTNIVVNVETQGIFPGSIPPASGNPTPTPIPPPTTPTPTPTPTQPPTTPSTNPTPQPPTTSGGGDTNGNSASDPTAVITVLEKSIHVNEGVHVHALNSVLKYGTPLNANYAWNFGDPGSQYNNLVGFNAGHVYDQPGDYTVTLTLTNGAGNVDTAQVNIHVSPADRTVYYVANDGDDSNSGTDPNSPIQSIDKVEQILGSGNSNLEFRFNDGDTFRFNKGVLINGDNVVFTDYGSGSAPVIYWNGVEDYIAMIATGSNSSDVTIQHLQLQTQFGGTDKTDMPDAIKPGGDNLVVRNNEFVDIGYGVNCNANPDGVIVQKNDVPTKTALRSYFVWAAGADIVVLGNVVPNSTREADLRAVGVTRLLIGYNSFTNQALTSLDTAKNTLTIHDGSYAYIVGNDLHKGPMHVGPLGEADGLKNPSSRFNYAVIEGNLLDTESFTLHGAQHVMYRNNISTTNGYPAYNIEGYNSAYNRNVTDATYLNNTAINTDTDGIMFLVGSGDTGLTLQNNLYVAPNLTPGGDGAASPVYIDDDNLGSFNSISNNVWASGDNGSSYANGGVNYIYSDGTKSVGFKTPTQWNSYGVVGSDIFSDVSIKGFTPKSGSAADDEGMQEDGVFFDYYGNARPANGPITAGAVQL